MIPTEVATLFIGVAIIVGACIAGGAIYAGLQKVCLQLQQYINSM